MRHSPGVIGAAEGKSQVAQLGYAWVSTAHQDLERQLDSLAAQQIPSERIWQDKKTGATVDRPGFAEE